MTQSEADAVKTTVALYEAFEAIKHALSYSPIREWEGIELIHKARQTTEDAMRFYEGLIEKHLSQGE